MGYKYFDFKCFECGYKFDELIGTNEADPTICPECKAEAVKRIPSIGHCKMELSGQDLVDYTKRDAQRIKQEAHKNENIYANLVGESKYNEVVKASDKAKAERGKR
jgi:putative FmdB family regulatory protein